MNDPITPSDMVTGGVSAHFSTGGDGGNVVTCDCNLRLGSDSSETFFDLDHKMLVVDSGKTISLYSNAMRGGQIQDGWAVRTFKTRRVEVADDDDIAPKKLIEGVRQLYQLSAYRYNNNTGGWIDISGAQLFGGMVSPVIAIVCDGDYAKED